MWLVNPWWPRWSRSTATRLEGYRRHTVHGRGESIALLALPDVAVAVAEIAG
ncbi:MAG: hypothetical protein U0531_16090 [Dehalococcoidia bacterium]